MKFSFPNSKKQQQEKKVTLFVCERMLEEARWLKGSSTKNMLQKAIVQSVLEPDLLLKSTLLQLK
jgi:hypothetical protein